MFECERCGGESRVMVMMQVSAPSSMMYKFSKKNMASKEFTIWGVNWETADFICTKCGYTTNGYGNYVKKLEKENEELKQKLRTFEVSKMMDQLQPTTLVSEKLYHENHKAALKEFTSSLTPEQRAELLIRAKILDEDGNYHKDFFSEETVEKSKRRKADMASQ